MGRMLLEGITPCNQESIGRLLVSFLRADRLSPILDRQFKNQP